MIEKLRSLTDKKEKFVVGLISGTSMDGIDAALLKISGNGTGTRIELVNFICVPYQENLRQGLEALWKDSTPADISRLDFLIGAAFADAALKVINGSGIGPDRVDLIGSHGQTVYHNPPSRNLGIPSTLQLGELDVIAETTGITTVGDFRTRDIAAGGEGAPLVPYPDYLLFHKPGEVRIAQNIGGIANATVIPGRLEDVTAFDTGPGNMLMDRVINISTGGKKRFDEDGEYASRGEADDKLLKELLSDPYFVMPPPKSTGEELFGTERAEALVLRVNKGRIPLIDLMATLIELTVKSISLSYERFIFPHHDVNEIILSGGGCRNPILMARIVKEFPGLKISTTDDYGIPSDAKEAVAFAVLANELISGNPGNICGVTGASHRVPLGKIVLGGL
ncbi:MAG TPA: anhydro-N-acetylmuramic acid kinase [Thermodesulfobacteriota bacterium]|nr:anhydro-N-acetylmuramic acid kinase [Thermodesulfobacteriota bacterium]